MNIREFNYKNVTFIEIQFESFKVTLSNLAASIYEITSEDDELTLTPSNFDDYLKSNVYHGKTIGPVANRIKNSTIEIDNKKYTFVPNEGSNLLHSGIKGLSNKLFNYEICNDNGDLLVIFTLLVQDLEDNFPGNRLFKITYKFVKNENLNFEIKFEVQSNKNSLIRLTNHTYFNLGESDICNLKLMIPSKKFIYPDDMDLCPTEDRRLIEMLDFNRGASLSKAIDSPSLKQTRANGLDHFIYFDDKKCLQLTSSKYALEIDTDFDGVQLYSDNYEDGLSYKNIGTKVHRGLAVEPTDSYLKNDPTMTYKRFIKYKISKLN